MIYILIMWFSSRWQSSVFCSFLIYTNKGASDETHIIGLEFNGSTRARQGWRRLTNPVLKG